jgi:DNA-binding transcriptional ArsR family regulator
MPTNRSRAGPGAPQLTPGVAEIRALAHPLRLRLMELFAETPRTTKQAADLLDEPPTRLYHHVAALERAGLIRLKETRQNRGITEKWYEATSLAMGSSGLFAVRRQRSGGARSRSKRESAARRALVMSVLTQSRQEVVAAMAIRGRDRPILARLVIVAPAARLRELRQRLFNMLKEIREELEGENRNAGTAAEVDRWALTLTFAPVSPSPRPESRSAD